MDGIRDYVYSNLEWAFSGELYVDVHDQIFNTDKPWEDKVYELLEPDTVESSGYCGGMALTLATVYNMLGYDSCALDMAVFDEHGGVVGSHVVTLVEMDDQWIVEDPSFNLTYLEDGRSLPVEEIIGRVRERQNDRIETREGDSRWRKGVFYEPGYEGTYLLKEPEEFTEYEGGYYSYVDMKPEMWTAFDEMYEYFEQDGYERDVLGIYAYPYAVYWPDNTEMNIIERKIFQYRLLNTARQ